MFIPFEICDAEGKPVPRQHARVYIAKRSIQRIVKVPDQEDITYLDLGETGVYVRGHFDEIAEALNEPPLPTSEWTWPNEAKPPDV